jgi:hypothetical protein
MYSSLKRVRDRRRDGEDIKIQYMLVVGLGDFKYNFCWQIPQY